MDFPFPKNLLPVPSRLLGEAAARRLWKGIWGSGDRNVIANPQGVRIDHLTMVGIFCWKTCEIFHPGTTFSWPEIQHAIDSTQISFHVCCQVTSLES
jgi:hypothetical protein